MSQPPILITTTGRAGSSMVCGILRAHGVYFGRNLKVHPVKQNPKGYFEHLAIEAMLRNSYLRTKGIERFEQFLQNDGWNGKGPWAVKTGYLCMVFPRVHRIYPQAKWVIVCRSREGVLRSDQNTPFTLKPSPEEFVDQRLKDLDTIRATPDADFRDVWSDPIVHGNYDELRDVFKWLGLGPVDPDVVDSYVDRSLWSGA